MPAPIVYDGVSGGGGRDDLLFSGIKFWLAVRVPSRLKFKEKIQSNGGEVVHMERQADILIADDAAPKKAPLNWDSYSWKFIDAAIEKGELPDKADYLIPRPGMAVTRASVPANGSSKGTRTPFTTEDDRIITECARRQLATPQGVGFKGSLKGNAFWAEFAAKNPRHTAQSWRDRWLRKLAHLPGNDQPLEAEPEETTTQASMEPTARTLDQSGPRSKSPQPKSNPQVLHAKARTAKEGGRQRFTAAEDKALIEAVDDARRLGENIGGKLFYEEFAKDNPTHTAESWRSRYHRTLAPRLFPNGLPVSDDQPEAIRRVVTKTRHTTETEESPHCQPDSPRGERSQAAREEDPTENADDLVDPATLEAQEAQPRESRTPSPQPPKSAVNGESMEGYHGESHIPSTPTHDRQTTTTSNEAHSYREFYDYLEDYVIKFPNTIDTKPRIRGVKIDLFRLQKAVESQEVDFDELDWSLVCEDIGFESPDSDLVKSVEECYGANLQGFVEVLRGFNECGSEVVSPESDSGSRLSVDQDERPESDTMLNRVSLPGREGHRGSDNDELADVQSGSASSPTPRHLGKRQRTRELFNERHKRRRLARDIEIPDTPEATSKFRLQSPFDEPDNEGNEEEGEGDEDVEDTEDPSGNSPSQQLRSELAQSVSSRNSEQSSSQDHPTAVANGRIKAPIAEIGESLQCAAREKLPKQGRLPDGPAATRNINKNVDAKSASSRTVSRVSTHQTQGANPAPRSAQPPPITVRSTPTKKAFQPNKEVSVRSHVFSTPRPSASPPMGVDSPLASIPHDILSDIISSPGTRRQTASFVTPSASSRRAPESSRRPPAQQNSPKILHQHPQKILPSIEGGHNSIASTSRCSEEVKRLAALGYRQEFIDKLLHATSRDVTVMKKVCELKAQKKSKGYGAASGPSESMPNMRGVWTADEDRKLVKIYEFDQMDDADKTAAAQRTRDQDERVLKQKHGWEGALEARRRFLQRQSEVMG